MQGEAAHTWSLRHLPSSGPAVAPEVFTQGPGPQRDLGNGDLY